jgi:hypothetical protein
LKERKIKDDVGRRELTESTLRWTAKEERQSGIKEDQEERNCRTGTIDESDGIMFELSTSFKEANSEKVLLSNIT